MSWQVLHQDATDDVPYSCGKPFLTREDAEQHKGYLDDDGFPCEHTIVEVDD